MRTGALFILVVAAFLLSATTAAGTHDETSDAQKVVDETLGKVSVPGAPGLPGPEAPLDGHGDDDARGSSGGFAGSVIAAVGYVGQAAGAAGDGVLTLGLGLVATIFGVFSAGGQTAVSAMDAVSAAPAKSAGIATVVALAVGSGIGLLALLQRYGSFGAIPLFTRIAKNELLENKVRAQIFDLIKENPGVNVSEIARRLDIAWGTATHHLQKLRAERIIAIRRVANQKCYFQNGGTYTPTEMDLMSATKNPTARAIAALLVDGGPHCHQDIARNLEVSPALVSFHMRKLLEAGVVAKERQGRRTIFSATMDALDPTPRPAVAH
jgi:predicted transcriptional regulator